MQTILITGIPLKSLEFDVNTFFKSVDPHHIEPLMEKSLTEFPLSWLNKSINDSMLPAMLYENMMQ